MTKLVTYWNDETRVFIESNYTHDDRLRLLKQSSYEEKPVELGEFRMEKGNLLLVLAKDSALQVVTETAYLKPVEASSPAKKDEDIPF